MKAELLVNVAPFETRIARIENGKAEEVYIERERERGLKGNIYKGRVQRVLPGIQAAFVDIGMIKSGFLYAGDVAYPEHNTLDEVPGSEEESTDILTDSLSDEPRQRDIPPINTLLREGQEILVQVSKDPIASKGPRLTSHLSLAGRFLVYLPDVDHIGIARRLEDPDERDRLRKISEAIKPEGSGLIVRTVAEGHSKEELKEDLDFLLRLWADIEKTAKNSRASSMIHTELNLYLRVMRDYVDDDVSKIHIDSREAYQSMKKFAKRFMPEVNKRLFYYPGERPIFDVYGVEESINSALDRRVPLKSGGHLVIDQTEALIAIDVNSGSFVSSRNMEETSFKTNLEAINEIVHQLRLRNLGGIIVIDFIDMQDYENKTRLMETLDEALKRDKTKTNVAQLSPLGLVEMTRKRTRESLGRMLLQPCMACEGTGMAKSPTTICYQIFRDVVAEARAYPCEKMVVIANPSIIDLMLGEESEQVSQLEAFLGKQISLRSDDKLSRDQYEVALS
ncbi:MAG: Rne/Rng family ribonuclease [Zetaproteobacteria bacterium CG_4_9_14_3_um_filter_49_83]|nr:MAG: ribonuclease E/G [Zetaproteobacteria bacterium CG1_02_49_23]PIQ30252.1 MAG: Rne/Rng family ribonuclease [Zetaproteobacteria bacterium CG17_big_fil_post_rev_8_21_14_2_50_50_13]PIV30360.1 MAG: Rne/Rng family ribonuclease [Zetaproteobacteria bacterium CG02_land_8_20_14_3_00_50_9]PIY56322.1 MAG: Rne/Rng family ribonuclease [Zetaproteobacteria bacterium CG_4_10_14_0_8_um_filter_49_80]PJA35259.1 MAG: Rne/Rng family ribonuclease [Zetaproteobacteria bacterium CG_4_9_14_3_um_filter_49_83]